MSIIFGSNGEISCNSIMYNWGVARNLLAESNPGELMNGGAGWSVSGTYDYDSTGTALKARSYRCICMRSSNTVMISQTMPTPTASHKYYGSVWFKASSSFTSSDNRFEWYLNDTNSVSSPTDTTKTNVTDLVFANKTSTNGEWKLLSNVLQAQSYTSGTWQLRNFIVNGNEDCHTCRYIIFDINEAFGDTIANSFPNSYWKTWCDEHLKEHRTFINFDTTSSGAGQISITRSQWKSNSYYGYRSLNSNWEPRDAMHHCTSSSSYNEGFINVSSVSLGYPSSPHYGFMETRQIGCEGYSNDIYFPVAEPLMGSVTIKSATKVNKYGGCKEWHRVSAYTSNRSSWSSGTYTGRFDLNNNGTEGLEIRACNFSIKDFGYGQNLSCYNSIYGTSITTSDINKEWCDCWIDDRAQTFIHCPSPVLDDRAIKFNSDYDIICNDIIIEPERTNVYMDPYGILHCKKLTMSSNY